MDVKVAIIAVILGCLCGCGVTNQDQGTAGADVDRLVNGRVVDGYIASATVFVDSNENGIKDAWENSARTDSEGYYTYNPNNGGINYCAPTTSANLQIHCLQFPFGVTEARVQIVGGYDITTGESFKGIMAFNAQPTTIADVTTMTIGSPLTSLLSYMSTQQQQSLAKAENFSDVVEMKVDFLSNFTELDGADEDKRRKLVTIALQVHKIADLIHHFIDANVNKNDSSSVNNGNFFSQSLPDDFTPYIYQAMATLIAEELLTPSNFSLNNYFKESTNIDKIINTAASIVREKLSEVSGGTLRPLAQDTTASRIVEFSLFTQALFGTTTNVVNLSDTQDLQARLRALEVVVELLRIQENITAVSLQSSVDNAIAFATIDRTENDEDDVAIYLRSLSDTNADIQEIVTRFKANDAVTVNAFDFNARQSLQEQLGLSTDLNNVTEPFTLNIFGSNSSTEETNQNFNFIFNPDGTLVADINVLEGKNTDLQKNAIPGTWKPINENTLLLDLEVADGIKQSVIMKTDASASGCYKFDYGGQSQQWCG